MHPHAHLRRFYDEGLKASSSAASLEENFFLSHKNQVRINAQVNIHVHVSYARTWTLKSKKREPLRIDPIVLDFT